MDQRFKETGTTGILMTMKPNTLNIFDKDATVPDITGGAHSLFGYDAETRNAKENAYMQMVQSDLDNLVVAKEKAAHDAIKQKNSDQTLARIATSNEVIAGNTVTLLKKAPFSDPSDQQDADMLLADSEARAAAAKRKSSGSTAELPSDQPTAWTAADPAKVATLIATKRFPDPKPSKSKKIIVPPINGWAGAHDFQSTKGVQKYSPDFAGLTANVGNWRLRQTGLRKANKAKDKAQDELDALNLETQRKDRANDVAGRFQHLQRLAVEWTQAETEMHRAAEVLNVYSSHLVPGGFTPADLAGDDGPVEAYRRSEERSLQLRGDLDSTNEQIDLDLKSLTPDEQHTLGIKRIPVPEGQAAHLQVSETDLQVRFLTRQFGGSPADLSRLKNFIGTYKIADSDIPKLKDLADAVNLAEPVAGTGKRSAKFDAFMENLGYGATFLAAEYKRAGMPDPTPENAVRAYLHDGYDKVYLPMMINDVRTLTPTYGVQWVKNGCWFASIPEWRTWALTFSARYGEPMPRIVQA